MSLETAKRVIDHEIRRFPSDAKISIEMIGGEPFLPPAFRVFSGVVDYIGESYPEKDIDFIVTTNGTLVHDEVQQFLLKHSSKIRLSLSLDGRQRSHDINRPMRDGSGSFDRIDIPFFQNFPTKVTAKMTVSPLSLKYLADDVIYVSETLGFTAAATLATGIPWEKDFKMDEMIQQLDLLVDHYIENPTLELPMMLSAELEGVFAQSDPLCKPCGAGEVTRAFGYDCLDENGNITWYPCQGLSPISLGEADAEPFKCCDFNSFCLKEPCASCKFRPVCHACQATNYGSTGDIESQSSVMCLMDRLCALASSKILYHRMRSKDPLTLTPEDQALLKAIYIVQTEIFDDKKHRFLYRRVY